MLLIAESFDEAGSSPQPPGSRRSSALDLLTTPHPPTPQLQHRVPIMKFCHFVRLNKQIIIQQFNFIKIKKKNVNSFVYLCQTPPVNNLC